MSNNHKQKKKRSLTERRVPEDIDSCANMQSRHPSFPGSEYVVLGTSAFFF